MTYGIKPENRGGALKLVPRGIEHDQRVALTLCTAAGRNVFNKTIASGESADVSHLPWGVYVARVHSAAQSMNERIVIGK
ncbi:MAG: T9SS type A sorting domain-containing protein [Chitinispirillaceae bacterium]|nr:T9SS type A sorting domain-containing protein [Chitinispirillaceae bacterium]